MNYKIAVIKGDGIGPEIVEASMKVLDKIGEKYGHTFDYTEVLAGGAAIDACGTPLPQETVDICKASDAVLLGALGGPKWDNLPGGQASGGRPFRHSQGSWPVRKSETSDAF